MFFTIAVMVTFTVAIAAKVLAPRLADGKIIYRRDPDAPCAFGRRMAWLAIRSRDTEAIAEALGLADWVECNWSSGIGTVYDSELGNDRVFVSPPVNGWTFVVGLALPYPMGRSFTDTCTPLLQHLGRHFVEVQFFFSYPPVDIFAWARLIEGRFVRAFAITDQGIVLKRGRTTREERALGLKLFDFRGVRGRDGDAGGEMIFYPTEQHVLQLAQRWSINPTTLDAAVVPVPGLGLIALAPAAWRPTRLRKAG